MEFDTLGGAKLQPLHCRLGVDVLVHEVGLETTGGDGEQVINESQRWYGDQVLVVVELFVLLLAIRPHGVNLEAGDQVGQDITLHAISGMVSLLVIPLGV